MIYCTYNNSIYITFDTAKRDKTLAECGVDFAEAGTVFMGHHFTVEDDRQDYGESRFITVGFCEGE